MPRTSWFRCFRSVRGRRCWGLPRRKLGFPWPNKTRFCPRPYAPSRGRTETASTRLLRHWFSSRLSQKPWGWSLTACGPCPAVRPPPSFQESTNEQRRLALVREVVRRWAIISARRSNFWSSTLVFRSRFRAPSCRARPLPRRPRGGARASQPLFPRVFTFIWRVWPRAQRILSYVSSPAPSFFARGFRFGCKTWRGQSSSPTAVTPPSLFGVG
mmetsp:Transcript_24636/g.79552  ORF Transcript_24636/g.79552 Transcript_24636/m.79552 type:complete len:214 (-) Transcript_24636:242-883(-)